MMVAVNILVVLILIASVAPRELILKEKHNFVQNPCENNEDCEGLENAVCTRGFCSCNGSNNCIDQVNRVVSRIGETCKYLKDCHVEFSECSPEKICLCQEGMVPTTDARKCLQISEGLGGRCEDSVQCQSQTPHSGCQENKCVCQQQMHEFNGLCFKNVAVGNSCDGDEECSHNQFSKCVNSKCACVGEYVASGSRCLLKAKGEDSSCTVDVQCTAQLGGASHCLDGFCKCKELYQLKTSLNKCVRDMLLGERCMRHSDCHDPMPGKSRSECVLGVCKCQSSFSEEDGFCISCSSLIEKSVVGTLTLFLLVKLF